MSMDTEINLSDNLRNAMELAKITAADLSRQSGVSISSMNRILSGQGNPSIGNVMKIAEILGVSLDKLTGQPLMPVEGGDQSRKIQQQRIKEEHARETDILASFELHDTELNPAEAARLLSSAANGSWVNSWTDRLVDHEDHLKSRPVSTFPLSSSAVSVDMAFPHELIEEGSIVSLLSVIGAAVTGTDAKITDVRIPSTLVRTFKGASYGVRGLRDTLNKYGRPLLSVTMRPMNGLSAKMYGRAVYEALSGGCDMACDPTMMHSLPENRWRERFRFGAQAQNEAETRTNERKLYVANVTASDMSEMVKRVLYAQEQGLHAVMIDSAAIGWTGVMTISNLCHENDMMLFAMGGRALQGGVMSEQLIAKLLRFAGADVVSVASPLGGNAKKRRQVKGVVCSLIEQDIAPFSEDGVHFDQPTCRMNSSMPACGGGHNPWHFPRLIDALGDDHIIQCGGSVMGHPWGSEAGATATRTAVEALVKARQEGANIAVEGHSILQEAAHSCGELEAALAYWTEGSFLFGVIDGDGQNVQGIVKKEDDK